MRFFLTNQEFPALLVLPSRADRPCPLGRPHLLDPVPVRINEHAAVSEC